MDRNTNILCKRLIDLNQELEADLKLDEITIKEKSLSTPAIKSKWLMIFFEEQKMLDNLKKAEAVLVDKYVSSHGKQDIPKFKTAKEANDTEDIKKIKRQIENQQDVVRYLEGVLKIMNNFGFDIKNSIELIKIESS